MVDITGINSPTAAFVAGLVTSLHCAGMCGPLACTLMPVKPGAAGRYEADPQTISTVYHVARLASYGALGAFGGALGAVPLSWLSDSAIRWIPWALVLFFVTIALRWERFLPRFAALGKAIFRVRSSLQGRSRLGAAAVVGFGTPLLPCGPLYLVVTVAMLTGSALRGVEFMLAFGIGTVPLLWLAQTQFHWVRRKLSPLWLNRTRVTLALITAGLLAWRLRATLGFPGPGPNSFVCH